MKEPTASGLSGLLSFSVSVMLFPHLGLSRCLSSSETEFKHTAVSHVCYGGMMSLLLVIN